MTTNAFGVTANHLGWLTLLVDSFLSYCWGRLSGEAMRPLVTNPSPMWARNADHKETANPPRNVLTLRNHLRLASYLITIPLVGCCLYAEHGHKFYMGGTGCHSSDRPDRVHCSEEEIESQKENSRIPLRFPVWVTSSYPLSGCW